MSTKHFLTRDPHDSNMLHLYEHHGQSVHHVYAMSTEDLLTVYDPDGGHWCNDWSVLVERTDGKSEAEILKEWLR